VEEEDSTIRMMSTIEEREIKKGMIRLNLKMENNTTRDLNTENPESQESTRSSVVNIRSSVVNIRSSRSTENSRSIRNSKESIGSTKEKEKDPEMTSTRKMKISQRRSKLQ
jgi:hypothetical protein